MQQNREGDEATLPPGFHFIPACKPGDSIRSVRAEKVRQIPAQPGQESALDRLPQPGGQFAYSVF